MFGTKCESPAKKAFLWEDNEAFRVRERTKLPDTIFHRAWTRIPSPLCGDGCGERTRNLLLSVLARFFLESGRETKDLVRLIMIPGRSLFITSRCVSRWGSKPEGYFPKPKDTLHGRLVAERLILLQGSEQ